ncbi:MAG: OsmC family peroxiredoxin [Chloroflexi bacterium]|nr:MAG: OsmC family peroxiredoxin [Chloroflexota bacterium]
MRRTAEAFWQGDSRSGKGTVSTESGALKQAAYTWHGRFEDAPGTNPEELIAAAHAGCFTMAFAGVLGRKNLPPDSLHTNGTVIMEKIDEKWTIVKVRLEVEGSVPNIDAATFKQLAEEAEKGCPISRLLRPGLKEVEVVARLK